MDAPDWIRFIFSFFFVLALIGLLALCVKRFGLRDRLQGARSSGGRLSVRETFHLDARRKLVLVRRDDAEHLLLITPTSELVIESGIKAPMMDGLPPSNPSGESRD